jgi:hypothetical protein
MMKPTFSAFCSYGFIAILSSACGVFILIESRVSGSGLLANVEIGAGAPFGRCAMSAQFFLQKLHLRPDSQECR